MSADTIRRRLKAGELEGRRKPMGRGYRWTVQLPEGLELEPWARTDTTGGVSPEVHYLTDARARIAWLERLMDELAADRDHWRGHAH